MGGGLKGCDDSAWLSRGRSDSDLLRVPVDLAREEYHGREEEDEKRERAGQQCIPLRGHQQVKQRVHGGKLVAGRGAILANCGEAKIEAPTHLP